MATDGLPGHLLKQLNGRAHAAPRVLKDMMGSINRIKPDCNNGKLLIANPMVEPQELGQGVQRREEAAELRERKPSDHRAVCHVFDTVLTPVAEVTDPELAEAPCRRPPVPIGVEQRTSDPRRNQPKDLSEPLKSTVSDVPRRIRELESTKLMSDPVLGIRGIMEDETGASELITLTDELRELIRGGIRVGGNNQLLNPGRTNTPLTAFKIRILKTKKERGMMPVLKGQKGPRSLGIGAGQPLIVSSPKHGDVNPFVPEDSELRG